MPERQSSSTRTLRRGAAKGTAKKAAKAAARKKFAARRGETAAEGEAETEAAPPAPVVKPRSPRGHRRSAVERLEDPPPATGLELIGRVSRAIERELMQIERIVGGHRVPVAQRSEAERRARTLASLARTLNEVKRLRAEEEKSKAADDDAVPRDLDEFRRELSRRLALMDAGAAPLPAGGDE